GMPTPPTLSLDEPLGRLSNAANNSGLWFTIAAALALAGGGAGRRARAARDAGHRRHVRAGEPDGEGDPAGAWLAMNEAERAGPSPAAAGLLNPVPAQRARLALAKL